MKKRKALIFVFLLVISSVLLNGCASLRKKFIRKIKTEEKKDYQYTLRKYDTIPTIELYRKHYIFWKNWNREIITTLGENSKKDKRCISEIAGNLQDMQAMLIDEKADELEKHIKVIRGIEDDISLRDITSATKTRIRRTLEKQYKLIKIDFTYTKMKPFIRSEFRRRAN